MREVYDNRQEIHVYKGVTVFCITVASTVAGYIIVCRVRDKFTTGRMECRVNVGDEIVLL